MTKSETERKAAEMRRAYKREWNRKNKDKNREYRKRYWMKKAQQAEQDEKAADAANTD